MENMELYNKFRVVPESAKKQIRGGRLRGMTDINPIWRIKMLTEAFGPCGIGWTVNVLGQRIVSGADGVQSAFVDVELRYQYKPGEWSQPIFGTGGAAFVDKENNGLYTSDEAFKKAYTDAISVACKMLGIGADVYWDKDATKYTQREEQQEQQKQQEQTGFNIAPPPRMVERVPNEGEPAGHTSALICADCGGAIKGRKNGDVIRTASEIAFASVEKFGRTLCANCMIVAQLKEPPHENAD